MRFRVIFLIMVALLVAACGAGSGADNAETIVLSPAIVPTVLTATPQPQTETDLQANDTSEVDDDVNTEADDTSAETFTGVQVADTSSQAAQSNTTPLTFNVQPACVVRTDLPIYTVVAGDTLFSIANRANMTVDEIVRVNCLADRNLIEVGQRLRVTQAITNRDNVRPADEDVSTDLQPPNVPSPQGNVTVSPWTTREGNRYTINTTALTFRWQGMPTDVGLVHVEFIYVPQQTPNSPISIGIDVNLSDGAQIEWTAPADMSGSVYATARLPGQFHQSVSSQASTILMQGVVSSPRGTIQIAPWQERDGNRYTINTSTTLNVRWHGVPLDVGLIQAEFIFVPQQTPNSPIVIGVDADVSDGARIDWNAPTNADGTVYAFGRIPGQLHQSVMSESSTIVTDNTPLRVGPRGALNVSPNLQAGTPQDWTDFVVEAGAQVTVNWSGVDPAEYQTIRVAELHYTPDNGAGGQIIGRDNTRSDGFTFSWTVPADASGTFVVNGIVGNTARYIFSPQIHVRTPDDVNDACLFIPYGIGGEISVYPVQDTDSTPLATIMTGTLYPILAQGGTWTTEAGGYGTFYQIDLGNVIGWVRDGRGGLQGNCSTVPTIIVDAAP